MTFMIEQAKRLEEVRRIEREGMRDRCAKALRLKADILDDRLETFRKPEREAPRLSGMVEAYREAANLIERMDV